MDNFAALQAFWESFEVDAYDEQTYFTKGDSPAFPHITYESVSGTWASHKVDDGVMWFRIPETTPFAQIIPSGSEDDRVKRILLYVEVEFLTVR